MSPPAVVATVLNSGACRVQTKNPSEVSGLAWTPVPCVSGGPARLGRSCLQSGGSAPQGRQERGREIPKRACCPEGQERRKKRSASCVFCSLAETPRRPSPHCPQREPVHRCPLISFPPLLYSLHSTPGLPGTISPKKLLKSLPKGLLSGELGLSHKLLAL